MNKVIRTKKSNLLMTAYQQGKIFKKFITNNKFINAVTKFEISKATINFKIGVVKFIDEYPKSRISLCYLKSTLE